MAIMQWRKDAAGYRAHWQGIQFLLTEHPTTHKWQLFANNRHVKEEYRSLHAAIADIEARQEKLVLGAARAYRSGFAEEMRDLAHTGGAHGASA